MTAIYKLTNLGNVLRDQYGTTDKYSLSDMAKMISGLEIHNFLDDGQKLVSTSGKPLYAVPLTGLTTEIWNKYLVSQNVTLSCDIKWSGFKKDAKQGRLGFEICTQVQDNSYHYNGVWHWLNSDSGEEHISTTWRLNDQSIISIDSAYIYNQINADATVEITNLKIVINPLGGGNPS